MSERAPAAWLGTDAGQDLVAHLVAHARKQYRITEDEALPIVLDALAGDRTVAGAVAVGRSVQQIERTRAFKDLASVTRRKIYYHLRRYDRANGETAPGLLAALKPGEVPGAEVLTALARGHVSTLERLPWLTEFHQSLFPYLGSPATLLDVGSGIYPLLFPFDGEGASVTCCAAVDKDPKSVAILSRYASARGDGRLVASRFDVSEGWEALSSRTGLSHFEVAFLFKLVPVLQRQDRKAYQILTAVPADLVVLTGATRSMTKHRSIERRERAVLLSFAQAAGLTVRAQWACGDEYLVVTSRDGAARPLDSLLAARRGRGRSRKVPG